MGKGIVLKAPKKTPKLYMMHTRPKKGGIDKKTTPLLYLQPNQSMKSKRDKELDPKCTLTHSKNMYIKERKIAWSIRSKSSKVLHFSPSIRYKISTTELLSSLLSFPPNKGTPPTNEGILD